MVTQQNPFQKSAQSFGAAEREINNLAAADTSVLGSMNKYLSPYYSQVIDATTRRLNENTQKNLNQVGAAATAAGSFGGARHGLLEAELYDNNQQQVGDMTSSLLMDRYKTAAQFGQQDVANNFQNNMGVAQGYGQLGQQMFGVGQQITQNQMQQGTMQQQLLQQILDASSGMFGNYINSPNQAIGIMQALLSGDPRNNAQTQSGTQPGRSTFMDLLSLGAQVGGAYLGGPMGAAAAGAATGTATR